MTITEAFDKNDDIMKYLHKVFESELTNGKNITIGYKNCNFSLSNDFRLSYENAIISKEGHIPFLISKSVDKPVYRKIRQGSEERLPLKGNRIRIADVEYEILP